MSAPPSTEEVRRLFVYGGWEEARLHCDEDAIGAEFDRWLAEVRKAAFWEGHLCGWTDAAQGQQRGHTYDGDKVTYGGDQ